MAEASGSAGADYGSRQTPRRGFPGPRWRPRPEAAPAMAAAAPAAPAAPGEAKRPEGDEWCDSGLGSLGEGPLGPPLPASPAAESPEPLADPAAWLRHVLSFVTDEGDT